MTDNALTMALGAVAELKRYGAVVVTFDGTHSEARAFVPRVLEAMTAHGIVARGAASIEGAAGAVTIEIPCDVPRDATTLVEVFASESADTTQPVARARRSPKQ